MFVLGPIKPWVIKQFTSFSRHGLSAKKRTVASPQIIKEHSSYTSDREHLLHFCVYLVDILVRVDQAFSFLNTVL